MVNRRRETWEKYHAVCLEIEALECDGKAVNAHQYAFTKKPTRKARVAVHTRRILSIKKRLTVHRATTAGTTMILHGSSKQRRIRKTILTERLGIRMPSCPEKVKAKEKARAKAKRRSAFPRVR